MKRSRSVLTGMWLCFCFLFAVHVYAFQAQSTAQPLQNQEAWLITGKQAVVLPSLSAAHPIKLDVRENTRRIVPSPDGRLVAVASYGAVKSGMTWSGAPEVWPESSNQSQITLLKRPGYEVAGQYAVPFRPEFIGFTSDGGTLAVVALGQVSKNEKKHIPPQVFLLDVASGKLRGQIELASEPIEPWFAAASNRLLIPCRGFEKRAGAGPELVIYDVSTGTSENTPLPSPPVQWLETGAEDSRYLELGNSVVTVGAEGKLLGAAIQAGSEKLFLQRVPNSHRLLLAGKTKKQGQLVVIEDGRAVKTLEVPPLTVIVFDHKASRMFLCASKQGFIYDLATLTELANIPLPTAILGASLAPGEKRLYVNEVGDHVTVIDLETKQVAAQFATGRGGVKFMQELRAAAASSLSEMSSQLNYGSSALAESYWVKNAVQSMAFSPSGNFVYVFNTQTQDITVVETKGHTSATRVPTGEVGAGSVYGSNMGTIPFWKPNEVDLSALGFLWLTPDGRYLVSCGLTKMLIFDTEKGEVLTQREFKPEHRRPLDVIPQRPLRYEPSLGLIFARSAAGTEIYRPGPFEKVKEFGPESALPSDKTTKGQSVGRDLVFQPEARRFFLLTTKGVAVYDYDLNLLGTIEDLPGIGEVHLIAGMPEAPSS